MSRPESPNPQPSAGMDWSAQRVLVTGAGGYLGSHLAQFLAARQPARLVLLCRGEPGVLTALPDAEILKLDLFDRENVLRYFAANEFDYIFNLAGKIDQGIRPGIYTEQFRIHVETVINLTDALIGRPLKRLIHVGSSAEYGIAKFPYTPGVQEHPSNAYSASKLAASKIVIARAISEQLPAMVVRSFLVYGERQHPQGLLATALAAAHAGRPFQVTGGEQTRDFTPVSKFCDDLTALAALPAAEAHGRLYNLCTGVETRVHDVLTMIEEQFPGFKAEYGSIPYRKAEVMHASGVAFRPLTPDDARARLRHFIAKGTTT